ncbi:MAG: YigZ family protein [Bacillus subtilis]|nr:YigZ family protein [Bacillus subtilis]
MSYGRAGEQQRYSDDGEPSRTAGLPLLELLLHAEATNVLAVVVRYFGGTLLGTGGLVRSYQSALKGALDHVVWTFETTLALCRVDVDLCRRLRIGRTASIQNRRIPCRLRSQSRVPFRNRRYETRSDSRSSRERNPL